MNLLVGREKDKDFLINAQELVTGRSCVIGQSGSGKSYLIGVVCEKLCESNIGFCIIDTEGEYYSLKEKFQLLWVGGEDADVNIEEVNFNELARKVVKENIPVILDVSDVIDEKKTVNDFANSLYNVESRLRIPYLLIIEESDKFVPQSKGSSEILEEISRRGRKRGLGVLFATQRPALVNKNVLSQCGSQIIGKLTTENDLQAVNLFFSSRSELEDLPRLDVGEFFVMGNISGRKTKIHSIERLTKHKGLTPQLIPKPLGKISELKESITGFAEETPERKLKAETHSLKPRISKEKALDIAESRRKKKYVVFGEKERITGAELIYHPLIFVEIKMKKGLIRKGFVNYSFILDGISGRLAELEDGLRFSEGFENILGLKENEAKVLIELSKSKKLTVPELESQVKISSNVLRKVLNNLQNKKLITYAGKAGRAMLYSPLIDLRIPDLEQNQKHPVLDGKADYGLEAKVREGDLREVLKAIDPTSEIIKFQTFFYPIFSVHFENRKLRIDAISGKEV